MTTSGKRHQNVLGQSHFFEKANILKSPGDPQAGNAMGRQAIESCARKLDCAGARRQQTSGEIEQRRFAGTVGADQAENPPLGHCQPYLFEHAQAAKMHRD
jgi:hypothetical protein